MFNINSAKCIDCKTSVIEITHIFMLTLTFYFDSRVVNSIFQYLPVFSSKCRYSPVNATGMENTRICRHFANLNLIIIPCHYCGYVFGNPSFRQLLLYLRRQIIGPPAFASLFNWVRSQILWRFQRKGLLRIRENLILCKVLSLWLFDFCVLGDVALIS